MLVAEVVTSTVPWATLVGAGGRSRAHASVHAPCSHARPSPPNVAWLVTLVDEPAVTSPAACNSSASRPATR